MESSSGAFNACRYNRSNLTAACVPCACVSEINPILQQIYAVVSSLYPTVGSGEAEQS